jgi:lysophospholipase L1-like esterase
MSCTIVGDSIAVGVGELRKDCETVAQIGIDSSSWKSKWAYIVKYGDVVLISLGTNDRFGTPTEDNLYEIRSRIPQNSKVLWILPANSRRVREIVMRIAEESDDKAVFLNSVEADGLHPTPSGYRALSKAF